MKREVPLEELKRLYGPEDMVRADCGGCAGCSLCCTGMGDSIVLSPLDLYRLEQGLGLSFGQLLEEKLELGLCDGLALPHLKMAGKEEACGFLDREKGRCRIHPFRPDLCRLFPLGRIYGEQDFSYYLQKSQCPRAGHAKVRVRKWIGIPEYSRYEAYILRWHGFQRRIREKLDGCGDEKLRRDMSLFLLNLFYAEAYDTEADFYSQFEARLEKAGRLTDAVEW